MSDDADLLKKILPGDPNIPPTDWEITDVDIDEAGPAHPNGLYFIIGWATKGHGFGELTFYKDKDGNIEVQTETLGKAFAKKVLCALVDKAKKTE